MSERSTQQSLEARLAGGAGEVAGGVDDGLVDAETAARPAEHDVTEQVQAALKTKAVPAGVVDRLPPRAVLLAAEDDDRVPGHRPRS